MGSELDTMMQSLMADDVVVGVSRAIRGAQLRPHQRDALQRASWILGYLSGAQDDSGSMVRSASELRQLVDAECFAQEVARSRSNDRAAEAYFGQLRETISTVLEGQAPEDKAAGIELLTFFKHLSEGMQARAQTDMAAAGRPAWMLTQPTGVS